jgi:AraC-like DNA-binding protein
MQWVTDQRVLYARRMLEETDLDIDRIADRSGFGTATLLRHHFRRIIGVTPSDYRRSFACTMDPDCGHRRPPSCHREPALHPPTAWHAFQLVFAVLGERCGVNR